MRLVAGTVRGGRRGMILLVVLAVLTLFSIIGVSFVFLADSLATSARIAREAEDESLSLLTGSGSDVPEFKLFLGQLIYGVPDDATGVYSALRGHDLGRNVYGYNDTSGLINDRAFSGTGLLDYPSAHGKSNNQLVNYTYFQADGFLRDPERLGTRPGLTDPKGAFIPEANPPYTYPDHNHMFLAAVRASDGKVLQPSFHRHWLFNPGQNLNDTAVPGWSSADGKYLTLRPRPADHDPTFPYPGDTGGDVKNLVQAPGGNDSIWIDIGAPVLTLPDGRKYKALIAPLIIDLDGRINLNAVGNILAANNGHGSNQGWGPWEVSLSKVLNPNNDSTEWQNIFLGTPTTGTATIVGRYGSQDRKPADGTQSAGGTTTPRPWAQVDFNGVDETTNPVGLTTAFQLPGTGGSLPYRCFPTFPAGFANGDANEGKDHPLLFNVLRPTNDDRLLPVRDMVALLRADDSATLSGTSDLMQLCPQTFQNAKIRRLVTTDSFDLDRAGVVPYVWDPAATPYGMPAPTFPTPQLYPKGALGSFPSTTLRSGPVPSGSEFDANEWRSVLAGMLRYDLSRPLRKYPDPDGTSGLITVSDAGILQQANDAISDRQQLATALYDRLRLATGAVDPAQVPATYPQDSNEFRALRWLAQLAVNIVDYIDEDRYNTPFTFHTGTNQTVIGTELPGLLLNEAYVQLDNFSDDTGITTNPVGSRKATKGYRVNVWLELINPLVSQLPDAAATQHARLQIGTQPVYKVVLAAYSDATHARDVLADPTNFLGQPSTATITPTYKSELADYTYPSDPQPLQTVEAGDNAFSDPSQTNKGFYAMAPDVPFLEDLTDTDAEIPTTTNPKLPHSFKSDKLSYKVEVADAAQLRRPTVFLQRLLCPFLPPNPDAGGTLDPALPYNPYVTVDVLRDLNPNEGRVYDAAQLLDPAAPAITARVARGRLQPYAGTSQAELMDQAPTTPAADQPKHTFYRHNYEGDMAPTATDTSTTLKIPFDWLIHLDRQLISPAELFHVSAYRPHELTTYFVQSAKANQHTARWLDEETRLYRFLELVQTRPRSLGPIMGGRYPGLVNINTVWDVETFRALGDAQPANSFYDGSGGSTDTFVDQVFQQILLQRTPGLTQSPEPASILAQTDRPFWGLGLGAAAGGDNLSAGARGIDRTLLAAITPAAGMGAQRLFEAATPGTNGHPSKRYELLTKIFSRMTTRSNVFAVWATVGFFEVMDDTTRPVKLGAEIGLAQNQQVRHRMFAIIDRTQLAAFSATVKQNITTTPGPYTTQASFELENILNPWGAAVPAFGGTRILTIDPDTDIEETVVATHNGTSWTADFRLTHAAGARVVCRGNPGPWADYDPYKDPCIRYFAILD